MENVLALRGDINPDLPRRMDFLHASDLAKAIAQTGGFGVAGACYPEGHVESPSLKADVESLRYKAEAGVSHLITQLFFDNVSYYRFLNMGAQGGNFSARAGWYYAHREQKADRAHRGAQLRQPAAAVY